jgi:hypothetical protein
VTQSSYLVSNDLNRSGVGGPAFAAPTTAAPAHTPLIRWSYARFRDARSGDAPHGIDSKRLVKKIVHLDADTSEVQTTIRTMRTCFVLARQSALGVGEGVGQVC